MPVAGPAAAVPAPLAGLLRSLQPLCVAFSGGVDSACVLAAAAATAPEGLLAVTGLSPSVPSWCRETARSVAASLGVRHIEIGTEELLREDYRSNPPDRCFACKDELYGRIARTLEDLGLPGRTIVDGTHADDAQDIRPGLRAARAHGVRSPLLEAGLGKAEVRRLSRDLGLPTWDRPSSPCLSSRFPVHTPIDADALARVERAETALRDLGFIELRVRHHGPVARIEVGADDLPRIVAAPCRDRVVAALRAAGYAFVSVDLLPFRSGSLNILLPRTPDGGSGGP